MIKDSFTTDCNTTETQFDDTSYPELNQQLFSNISSSNLINNNKNTSNSNKIIGDKHFCTKTPLINEHHDTKQFYRATDFSVNENKSDYFITQGSNTNSNIFITLPKNKIGRKRKNDPSIREHNKYACDNLRRKCKKLIINNALNFVNDTIKKVYNNNIGKGVYKKELYKIDNYQQYEINIKFEQKLLNKTLGEIFSWKISGKFTNCLPNHNQKIIEILLNEKDDNKKSIFQKLFKVTFLQCIKQFIGVDTFEELEGFTTFHELKEISEEEPEYQEALKFYFLQFEDTIKNAKERQPRTKK